MLVLATGCYGQLKLEGETPPFGTDTDLFVAEAVWTEITGQSEWASFPGYTGFQASDSPHGAYHQIFVNDTGAESPADLPVGSLIIKSNYGAQNDDAILGVTAMKKIANFNPDGANWFWAKYTPTGELDVNDIGRPMAGRIGINADQGCIPCHQGAPGGDFVFVNPIGAQPPVGPSEPTTPQPTFGKDSDVAIASELWNSIADHQQWPALDGREGVRPGAAPHGAFHTLHLNSIAAADQQAFADGSIIVKRNLTAEDPNALGALTVMQKIRGYNTEEGDWFWAKFAPDGQLETNGEGVALAGAIGKDAQMGCIACHANADGGDFVFENEGNP